MTSSTLTAQPATAGSLMPSALVGQVGVDVQDSGALELGEEHSHVLRQPIMEAC